MKKDIEAILERLSASAHGRETAFVIGNTSDLFTEGRMYDIPIRETKELIYGGVIVRDVETAIEVARLVDGNVHYLFVDDEKKVRKMHYGPDDVGNIEKGVRAVVKESILLTYKGNDLAVEATDSLLGSLLGEVSGKKVAIIGMGNLGSKVALKLVERGVQISAYRRDQEKLSVIVAGLNAIKSEDTQANIRTAQSITDACSDVDVVIGATNEKGIITREMLQNIAQDALLIDAGKGCFANEVTEDSAHLLYRIDVSMLQKHIFFGLIQMNKHYAKRLGRREVGEVGITLVSVGVFGRKGEVIVDDIDNPTSIIGISAGDGTLEKMTPQLQKRIEELSVLIGIS